MNRQICCHKTNSNKLYKCRKCGSVMDTDCIECFGKCHRNAGVYESVLELVEYSTSKSESTITPCEVEI
jgi:hypothetical protein